MIVYRLSAKDYCRDLSGYGADKNGGRWNKKGTPILYTASSRALAVVEIAVHAALGIVPINYYLATINIPDEAEIFKISINNLPNNWTKNPFVKETQQIGTEFVLKNDYLVLQVPSASVNGDYNYLVNPKHELFNNVKMLNAEPFNFDSRLFKK